MRRRGILTALRKNDGGVSALEFAAIAPVIALLVVGVIDLASGLWEQMQVSNAAQAGAFYASLQGWNSTVSAIESAVTSAAGLTVTATLSSSTSSACQTSTPTSFANATWCGCPSTTSGITTVTCGSTCNDGSTAGHYVTVCASASYTAIGGLKLPGISLPTTLTAQSYARIYP